MADDHRRGDFEQRAQSIIQAIVLAIVMWMGYTVIGLRDSSVEQAFGNRQTNREISELKSELAALRAQIVTISIAASQTAASAAATAAAAAAANKK